MNIIMAYATKNDCYIVKQPITPVGIVLRSTGVNNPNLKRYVDCLVCLAYTEKLQGVALAIPYLLRNCK